MSMESSSGRWVFFRHERIVVPFKALLAVTLYCLVGSLVFSNFQGLTAVESVYFMCVTMSTVGYGDFSPEGTWLRIFCVVWIFVAILVVFPQVTGAIVLFTGSITERGRQLLERVFPPVLVDVDGDGTADFKLPERHAAWFFAKNMLPAFLMWLVLQLVGAAGFVAIESIDNGWDFGSAFYHCIVTATTVGYGDMSIDTDGGMVWASVHIIFSVAMLGELVSTFDNLRGEWSLKKNKMEQLHNKMDPNLLTKLLSTIEKHDPAAGAGSRINQTQFLLAMLVESGALDQEAVAPLEQIFGKAPVDENGTMSRDDLVSTVGSMQESLAVTVAVAAGKAPPPPPTAKVAPEPREDKRTATTMLKRAATSARLVPTRTRVVTTDDLAALELEALAQLTLNCVKLSVVKKKIELLFPIEFVGAKSAGGTSGKYATPSLEDEATVRRICKEAAQALLVCNRLLVRKGFEPFGLSVRGHTSMQSETSQSTSFARAQLVATLLAEELGLLVNDGSCETLVASVAETGKGNLPGGGLLVSEGHGATQPLPGFDDGKNYKENRRVEIAILLGDEEMEKEVNADDAVTEL